MIVKSLDIVRSSVFTNSLSDATMYDSGKRERSSTYNKFINLILYLDQKLLRLFFILGEIIYVCSLITFLPTVQITFLAFQNIV